MAQALRIDVSALTGQPYVTELQQDCLGWAAERAADAQLGAIRQYRRAPAYRREGAPPPGAAS